MRSATKNAPRHIGAEFFALHHAERRLLDGDAALNRDWLLALGPLRHHHRTDAQGPGQSRRLTALFDVLR